MAREAILHVGLHKTGSTWLQHVFDRNRPALLAAGLAYAPLGACHGWPMVALAAGEAAPARMGRVIRRRARELRTDARAGRARALAECLDVHDRVLISGEQMSDALEAEDMPALRRLLGGAKVVVLAWLREPGSWSRAMADQRLRGGASLADLRARPPQPRYRRALEKFADAFGAEALHLRPFDRAAMPGGDIVADACAALGLAELAPRLIRPSAARANRALGAPGARLLDLRARALGRLAPGFAARRPPGPTRWLADRLPGAPLEWPPEALARARRRAEPDLAWLRELTGRDIFNDPGKETAA
ncbi:MAG: hypothetical protein AAFU61_15990 [Pseudomonadota bacterium]